MNSPADAPVTAWRNQDFDLPLVMSDDATGVAIDLTGATLKAQLRLTAGAGGSPALDLAMTATPFADGIYQADLAHGVFTVFITAATLLALPVADAARPDKPTVFAWDLTYHPAVGDKMLAAQGSFTLYPGVTR